MSPSIDKPGIVSCVTCFQPDTADKVAPTAIRIFRHAWSARAAQESSSPCRHPKCRTRRGKLHPHVSHEATSAFVAATAARPVPGRSHRDCILLMARSTFGRRSAPLRVERRPVSLRSSAIATCPQPQRGPCPCAASRQHLWRACIAGDHLSRVRLLRPWQPRAVLDRKPDALT